MLVPRHTQRDCDRSKSKRTSRPLIIVEVHELEGRAIGTRVSDELGSTEQGEQGPGEQ